MPELEIEVKFFLSSPETARENLLALGARRESVRVFERNLRFEDDRGRPGRDGGLLRLRQDRRARLTFKGDPGKAVADMAREFKVFRELEVDVSDFERTRDILEAIGFSVVQRYEKYRETFSLDGTECCLDTLPYGDFLEIEGSPEAIRTVADRLGLPWERRILANYLAMFEVIRETFGLSFSDLVFEHFESAPVDAAPTIRRFEAGNPPCSNS